MKKYKDFYYYNVSLYTYNEYIKEYNSNNLCKFHKLYVKGTIPKGLVIEIFDKKIDNVPFEIKKYNHPEYPNEFNYEYEFETEKGNKYRLDFITLKEENSKLKHKELHDKFFISIGFSIINADNNNYDKLTNRFEELDLFNRIIFLIKQFKSNINEDVYIFMFGDPSNNKKVHIYNSVIEKCFPDYKIIKDYTSGFDNSNIGFYIVK